MKPFLEIPVCLAGNDATPEKEVFGRVLPDEIAFYYPGYHWGAIVVLKSGHTFLTKLSCDQLEASLKTYSEYLKSDSHQVSTVKLLHRVKRLSRNVNGKN